MRALILLARQETRSYLKDPIDYFIFPGGKLLAERQKMFPTSRCQAPGLHAQLRGGLPGRPLRARRARGHSRRGQRWRRRSGAERRGEGRPLTARPCALGKRPALCASTRPKKSVPLKCVCTAVSFAHLESAPVNTCNAAHRPNRYMQPLPWAPLRPERPQLACGPRACAAVSTQP